jgi:hypothetical protein
MTENYLYFAEAVVETGSDDAPEAVMIPAKSFIECNPVAAGSTRFLFEGLRGKDGSLLEITLTHSNNKNKDVINAVFQCMNAGPLHGGFVVVADMETGTAVNKGTNIYPALVDAGVSAVAIKETSSQNDLAASGGAISYGAGALGTGAIGGPEYRRWTENGVIVNQVKIDITGLAGNADEGDVIGLAAGGAAYIFRQVVATTGVIFKVDMACVEAPTSGSNNQPDIDLRCNGSSVAATTDGNGYTAIIAAGGAWTYGSSKSTDGIATCGAANDYYYLIEGAASGGANTYTAGQFIITFYGHPNLG